MKSFTKVTFILFLTLTFIFIAFSGLGGGTKEPEVIEKEVPVQVEKIVEVEKESPYTFEKLLAMAKAGNYEGSPAKGHKLAFANFLASLIFLSVNSRSINFAASSISF